MRYMRCKCGERQCWTSMGHADCDGCTTCGTTLEEHPEYHRTPTPHKFETKYDEYTGKPYEWCPVCGRTKQELDEQLKQKEAHA